MCFYSHQFGMGHFPFRHLQLCFFGSTSLTALRWKEQYFVNVGTDCGLTIAGFYYVWFSCSDCAINGFYYDPNNRPFQKLELKSTHEGRSGFNFSSYELQ
ncbi:hypothetical protein ACSBR2_016996 [Camellia fascicularis]